MMWMNVVARDHSVLQGAQMHCSVLSGIQYASTGKDARTEVTEHYTRLGDRCINTKGPGGDVTILSFRARLSRETPASITNC